MAYEKVGWKDYPDKTTPMSSENLRKMDEGIAANDRNIGDISKISDIADGTLAGAVAEIKEENSELNSKLEKVAQTIYATDKTSFTSGVLNQLGEGVVIEEGGLYALEAYIDFSSYNVESLLRISINGSSFVDNAGHGGRTIMWITKLNAKDIISFSARSNVTETSRKYRYSVVRLK